MVGMIYICVCQNFLDEMFWYENPTLTAPRPVQQAKTYFDTCFKSTTTKDDLVGSDLLNNLYQKLILVHLNQIGLMMMYPHNFRKHLHG